MTNIELQQLAEDLTIIYRKVESRLAKLGNSDNILKIESSLYALKDIIDGGKYLKLTAEDIMQMTDFCFPVYYNIHVVYPEFFDDLKNSSVSQVYSSLKKRMDNVTNAVHNLDTIL